MKKRNLIPLLVLTLMILLTAGAGAANINEVVKEPPTKTIGLDLPQYGWVEKNDQGQITGYKGFNLALGYSKKNYFEPGLKTGEFNPYWGWGTLLVIVPYGEIGGDYVFEPNESGNFWTIGGAIGLPYGARASVSYRF